MSLQNPAVEVFTANDIARPCSAFALESSCQTREHETDRRYAFTLGEKRVEFAWPRHAPEELWVALSSSPQELQCGTADLVMIEEPMTRTGCDWMIGFLQRLGWRYLRSPTRLRRHWVIVGSKRIECFDGEQWKGIYRDFD